MVLVEKTGVDSGDAWRWSEVLQSTAIALLAAAICLFPRLMPWLLVTLAALFVVPDPRQARMVMRQALAGIAPLATLALPGLGQKKVVGEKDVARRPGWHSHNFYLQARLELGFVGSLLALAFGLAMLAAASRLHRRLVPWGYGLVAATMVSAISGWGLWQYWFLAGLGANAVFLTLIDAYVRQKAVAVA